MRSVLGESARRSPRLAGQLIRPARAGEAGRRTIAKAFRISIGTELGRHFSRRAGRPSARRRSAAKSDQCRVGLVPIADPPK
jgi:hypothetical protein